MGRGWVAEGARTLPRYDSSSLSFSSHARPAASSAFRSDSALSARRRSRSAFSAARIDWRSGVDKGEESS